MALHKYTWLVLLVGFCLTVSSASISQRDQVEGVGVKTTCQAGEYCYCKYGRIRYGLPPDDWSAWSYVHNSERVLCHHDNANFPETTGLWFSDKYCECEKLQATDDVKAGLIPPGEVVWLFKVEAYHTPTDRVPQEVLDSLRAKVDKARGVIDERNSHWWYEELPKQIAVVGAGVTAGALVSIVAGPLVIAAIGTHSVVLGATAIIGAAGTNYVATASAKGATRLLLGTDDQDRAIFDGKEAIVEIGARAATLGIMEGAGLHQAITHGIQHGLHAVNPGEAVHHGEHMVNLGDKIVTWVGGTVVEVPIEQIHTQGLQVIVEAGDGPESREVPAREDKIPSITPEATSLGIILNLLISGATIHSTMYGRGLAGYPALADNLEALQKACLATIQTYGPGDVPDRRLVELAIAERTVGQIFHPNHDSNRHFNNYPGSRFPECVHDRGSGKFGNVVGVVPSRVPVCYCIRHGYIAKRSKGPELGVDVDFCIYGQVCVPGEGVSNAKCTWPNAQSQHLVGRLFAAFNAGVKNCIAQHLNGWRCTQCQMQGQECITEDASGVCAITRDEKHGYTCKRPGVPINEDGTPVRPNQKKSSNTQRIAPGRLTLAAREVVFENRKQTPITQQTQGGLVVPPLPKPKDVIGVPNPQGKQILPLSPPPPKILGSELKEGVHSRTRPEGPYVSKQDPRQTRGYQPEGPYVSKQDAPQIGKYQFLPEGRIQRAPQTGGIPTVRHYGNEVAKTNISEHPISLHLVAFILLVLLAVVWKQPFNKNDGVEQPLLVCEA